MIKNKKCMLIWHISSLIFIILTGSFFHFAYELFGRFKPLALIFAVNESVWEHNKIGFWPAVIFSFVEYFSWGKYEKNYFCAKALQLFLIPYIITSFFYTYTGIIGFHVLWVDIFIFVAAVAIAQYVFWQVLKTQECAAGILKFFCIACIIILIIIFSIFTFFAPQIPLFIDPLTGKAGI